jgi:hypothetical protein
MRSSCSLAISILFIEIPSNILYNNIFQIQQLEIFKLRILGFYAADIRTFKYFNVFLANYASFGNTYFVAVATQA